MRSPGADSQQPESPERDMPRRAGFQTMLYGHDRRLTEPRQAEVGRVVAQQESGERHQDERRRGHLS